MSFNIDLVLISLVVLTGLMALLQLFKLPQKMPEWFQQISSFFPVLLLVLFIRSFVVQLHYVPTGSLEPTVLPGDLIVTNQFAYGLHLPITNTKLIAVNEPKVGDIVVFRSPLDPTMILVKRVIGTPGDQISYKNKTLTINHVPATQLFQKGGIDIEPAGGIPVEQKLENLASIQHKIFVRSGTDRFNDFDIIVPPHHYFMMGDNRDNSFDSRDWGFVPEKNLMGKAFGIVLSWDSENYTLRWRRFGRSL